MGLIHGGVVLLLFAIYRQSHVQHIFEKTLGNSFWSALNVEKSKIWFLCKASQNGRHIHDHRHKQPGTKFGGNWYFKPRRSHPHFKSEGLTREVDEPPVEIFEMIYSVLQGCV